MKMPFPSLILAGCALLLTGCGFVYPKIVESRPTLTGQVKDGKTGRPVEDVRVMFTEGVSSVTHTDEHGHFRFSRRFTPKLVVADPANTTEYPRDPGPGVFHFAHEDYLPLQLYSIGREGWRFLNESNPEVVLLVPKPASGEKPIPAPNLEKGPRGIPIPGKPGFVKSPHAPSRGLVDVSGIPPNTVMRCPYTFKDFVVP